MSDAADLRVALLVRYFLNRTDKVAVMAPNGTPAPGQPETSIEEVITGHVLGEQAPKTVVGIWHGQRLRGPHRVGSYTPTPDGTTRWLCLDFDGGAGHAASLQDPLGAVLAARATLQSLGIASYIERSASGEGYHLWVFFETPIPAAEARRLGDICWPRNALLTSGEPADPKKAHGIEIFPKSNRVGKQGCGMPVWLPFWHAAKPGGCEFYRVEADALVPDQLTEFVTVSPEALRNATRSDDRGPAPATVTTRTADESNVHKEWRERALARIDLTKVYGDYLTGKVGTNGWLECRDPESPTGDRTPSAGVADTASGVERGTFHSFRSGKSMSMFDFLVSQGRAADFPAACDLVAELTDEPRPKRSARRVSACEADPADSCPRPCILITGAQLRDMTATAGQALLAYNKARQTLFLHAEGVCRVSTASRRIDRIREPGMLQLLSEAVNWERLNVQGEQIGTKPDVHVARVLLEPPHLALPVLDGLLRHPIIGVDGEPLVESGYYREERLFLLPHGLKIPPVPPTPSAADVSQAKRVLREPVAEFCFADESDFTHYLAAFIQPYVRALYGGPSPLFVFDASTRGTGKTMLTKLIMLTAQGEAQAQDLPRAKDEIRKSITAALIEGREFVVWENVETGRQLDSGQLAAAVTADHWSDRVLGESRTVSVPNRSVWMLTGNNVSMSGELARRSVAIRLVSPVERPEERTFVIRDLERWVLEHRAELIHAVLVLARAWHVAGRPRSTKVLGSFSGWVDAVGGILEHAGYIGFLDGRDRFHDQTDASSGWRPLVRAWSSRHPRPLTATEVAELCEELGVLQEELGVGTARSRATRMGRLLGGVTDCVFDGYRIRRLSSRGHDGVTLYRLDKCGDVGDVCGTSYLEVPAL